MASLQKLNNGSSLHIHHFLHYPLDHSFLQLQDSKQQKSYICTLLKLKMLLITLLRLASNLLPEIANSDFNISLSAPNTKINCQRNYRLKS